MPVVNRLIGLVAAGDPVMAEADIEFSFQRNCAESAGLDKADEMGTGIDALGGERRGGLFQRCAGHQRGGESVAAGRAGCGQMTSATGRAISASSGAQRSGARGSPGP